MNMYAVEYQHNGEDRITYVNAESTYDAAQNLHPSIASRDFMIYLIGEVNA